MGSSCERKRRPHTCSCSRVPARRRFSRLRLRDLIQHTVTIANTPPQHFHYRTNYWYYTIPRTVIVLNRMPKRKAEESPSKEEAVRRSPPRARRPPDRLAVRSYKVDSSDESFASEEESDREENKEADDREENKEDDDKNDDKDDDKDEEGSEYQSKGSDNEDKQSDSDDDADASGDEQEDAASSTKSGDDEEEKRPHKKIKTVTEIFPTECEFCGKMFKNKYGYKYHSENNVCRRGSVTKSHRGKRKKSLASGKSFPKIRGKEEDRVCPHCNKKFTSSLGCQYHVSK